MPLGAAECKDFIQLTRIGPHAMPYAAVQQYRLRLTNELLFHGPAAHRTFSFSLTGSSTGGGLQELVIPACNADEVLDLALVEPYTSALEAIINLDIGKLKGHEVTRAIWTFHGKAPFPHCRILGRYT